MGDQSLAELKLLGSSSSIWSRSGAPVAGRRGGDRAQVEKIPLPDGSMVLLAGDEIDVIGPDEELKKYD